MVVVVLIVGAGAFCVIAVLMRMYLTPVKQPLKPPRGSV